MDNGHSVVLNFRWRPNCKILRYFSLAPHRQKSVFAYSNLRAPETAPAANGTFTVSVDVENNSTRTGDEVAQLYIKAVNSAVSRPAKELRGFTRVNLRPGQKQTAHFDVPLEKLAYWDETAHRFKIEPGLYEIQVGASSEDVRATTRIKIGAP